MFRGDFRGKYITKVKHVFKTLFLDTTADAPNFGQDDADMVVDVPGLSFGQDDADMV